MRRYLSILAIAAIASATGSINARQVSTGSTFKVAFLNMKAGRGQQGLAGHVCTFQDTNNCSDLTQPLNAWGVGVIQAELIRAIQNDPQVIAFGLAESWEALCGSAKQVQTLFGWAARTATHNGIAMVARYGFAGPEEWVQLDTSLNPNPADTMWVVRAPVCLDAACSQSVNVFATHWYAEGTTHTESYERQARQTADFLATLPEGEARVLVGDLNVWEEAGTVCNQTSVPSAVQILRDAGNTDAWPAVHGSDEGYTGMWNRNGCGVPVGYLWKRIDQAWSRVVVPIGMVRFGMVTPGECAPSDHAGIITEYQWPSGPDVTAPVVRISAPANGSTVSKSVTVAVEATDDTGVARVGVGLDGVSLGQDSSSPYQVAWDTTIVSNGAHTLEAWAEDAAGNRAVSLPVTVTVANTTPNSPPVASFTASCTNLVCTFTDQSTDNDGGVVGWAWTFGDGTTSSTRNPSHAYAAAGTYTVTQRVTDTAGATATATRIVTPTSAGSTFKVAFLNIRGGRGQQGLAGHACVFQETANCADLTQPLNAWGVGVIQDELIRAIQNDPQVIAFGLAESWESACGSAKQVQELLGWKGRTVTHNGIAMVARYGFKGPEEWVQLDTSLNPNPADTMWVVRAPVCLDAACSQSVNVFATHWYAEGTTHTESYERQARQTADFLATLPEGEARVLVGDLNVWEEGGTVCNQTSVPSAVQILRDAGNTDAWPAVHGSDEGYTGMWNRNGCGVPVGYLWKRIDQAWSRVVMPIGMVRFAMVTPGECAPSDHAGIIAEYRWPSDPDVTAPVVRISAPVNGSTVSSGVTVAVEATDNIGVSRVGVSLDGVSLGEDSTTPYQVAWDTTTASNGAHMLEAWAGDAAGNRAVSAPVSVTVENTTPNSPPVASFTASCNNLDCTFADQSTDSDGGVVGWAWTFGDGTTSSTRNPSHTYTAAGTYTVNLTATDTSGATGTATRSVTATQAPDSVPPTVAITYPSAGATLSGAVSITATATDNVGTSKVGVTIDDAPLGEDAIAPYAISWNTAATPDGAHAVRAWAEDAAGNRGFSAPVSVTVQNTPPNSPPVASFTAACTNLDCTFTDTSTDAGGSITSWAWTFGDGSVSALQNPTHHFATAGLYNVSLRVTDNAGATSTSSQQVSVTSSPNFDFTLTAAPSSKRVNAGTKTAYSLTTQVISGAATPIVLSVTGLPPGTTATFEPATIAGSGSSKLSVATTAATPAGTFALTVMASGGGVVHTTTVSLTIVQKR